MPLPLRLMVDPIAGVDGTFRIAEIPRRERKAFERFAYHSRAPANFGFSSRRSVARICISKSMLRGTPCAAKRGPASTTRGVGPLPTMLVLADWSETVLAVVEVSRAELNATSTYS